MHSPAKPSTPSRAYLHLTKEDYVGILADKVRNVLFTDIKGSPKEPASAGPPTVEFASYGRIPNGRARKDLRQGTIDQDQEFISFLESLTDPIVKPAAVDQGGDTAGKSKEKVTVTPLVQFIRDKKANKGKEAALASKAPKHARQDSKDNPSGPVLEKRPSTKSSNPSALPAEKQSLQAIKIEKATREVVQVVQQQVAEVSKSKSPPPSPASLVIEKPPDTAKPAISPEKKRERGNASVAARILQRDLGLGTNARGRGSRRGGSSITPKPALSNINSSTHKEESASSQSKEIASTVTNAAPLSQEALTSAGPSTVATKAQAPTPAPAPSVHPQPAKGPAAVSKVNAKATSASDAKPAPQTPNKKITKDTSVSPTATQAFLKHANPSQGITEALLEEAFTQFGTVKKVEIDKKKGFGYVDFSEPKSLQEAVKASPVKVAAGQVVVLERKTGPTLQARNARGGNSATGNRGGSPISDRGRGNGSNVGGGGGGRSVGGGGDSGGRGGTTRRGGGGPSRGRSRISNPILHNDSAAAATTAAAATPTTSTASLTTTTTTEIPPTPTSPTLPVHPAPQAPPVVLKSATIAPTQPARSASPPESKSESAQSISDARDST